MLDVNSQLYPMHAGEKYRMVLSQTLNEDGSTVTTHTQVSYYIMLFVSSFNGNWDSDWFQYQKDGTDSIGISPNPCPTFLILTSVGLSQCLRLTQTRWDWNCGTGTETGIGIGTNVNGTKFAAFYHTQRRTLGIYFVFHQKRSN